MDFMDRLDVEGWKAVLFVNNGGGVEEAPEDLGRTDPAIVRREQWVVAGDQYVLVWKDKDGRWRGPELGEHEAGGREKSGKSVHGLEDLLPLICRRLEAGEPRETMHPVLLAML